MSMEGGKMMEIGEMQQQLNGTRMTRIGRIFTDTHYPRASASSAQSMFYHKTAIFDDDKKPQMNADERRYAFDFSKIIHYKGRKERKALQQDSLCPQFSLWLNVVSTPAHERALSQPAPAVHPRSGRGGIY